MKKWHKLKTWQKVTIPIVAMVLLAVPAGIYIATSPAGHSAHQATTKQQSAPRAQPTRYAPAGSKKASTPQRAKLKKTAARKTSKENSMDALPTRKASASFGKAASGKSKKVATQEKKKKHKSKVKKPAQ